MNVRYDLYVITDEGLSLGRSHVDIAKQAIQGGADVIQLRDKGRSARELLSIASEIRGIVHDSGALFIVNDRMDVALVSNADGVHLGQEDLPLPAARSIAPKGFIIGISVGSVEEAVEAEANGADYIALSPTFSTASKDDAGSGHGLEMLNKIRAAVSIPLVAIGGINKDNVSEVVSNGADGVAVISAVVSQKDIEGAARELKSLIVKAKR